MTAFAFGLVFFRFSRFLPYFFRFHEYFSPILSQFNAHRVDFFHLVIVSYNVHRIHIMALQVVLRILDFPPLYIYFFRLLSIYSSCSVWCASVCLANSSTRTQKSNFHRLHTHTHKMRFCLRVQTFTTHLFYSSRERDAIFEAKANVRSGIL